MINMRKRRKNKLGFTLGEIVTTVAIIGTLTAIAVPNYMRIKMDVNMKMVQQHLRIIGVHLNDLYNQNRQFPEDILNLGNSGEEVVITASLNAIDNKEYTTDGYVTYSNRSTYTLRTCPKEGRLGISGDRCFLLDPSGIQETQLWGGGFAGDFAITTGCINQGCNAILNSRINWPNPSAQNVELFFLEFAARAKYGLDDRLLGPDRSFVGRDPGFGLRFNTPTRIQILNQFLSQPSFYQRLVDQGVTVSYFPPGTPNITNNSPNAHTYGFKLDPSFDPSQYQ